MLSYCSANDSLLDYQGGFSHEAELFSYLGLLKLEVMVIQ